MSITLETGVELLHAVIVNMIAVAPTILILLFIFFPNLDVLEVVLVIRPIGSQFKVDQGFI